MGDKLVSYDNSLYKIVLPTPFAVGPVNVYLLKGDRLTLIDVGPKTKAAWDTLEESLKRIGYQISDIEQVVVTHHHPDHVGLLDFFDKKIKVIGHNKAEPWMKKDSTFFEHHDAFYLHTLKEFGIMNLDEKYLAQVKEPLSFSCERGLTEYVKEGDYIAGHPNWQVIETPGHAQSHIAFYSEQDRILIGGDHIIKHISSNPLLEPPIMGSNSRPKPLLQYNHSLTKCQQMDISKVLSGHGEDVEHVHDLITERLAKQKSRAMKVYKWLQEKPMTAFEVCQKLFPKVYMAELALTMSETVGQLDYLIDNDLIEIVHQDKQMVYSCK